VLLSQVIGLHCFLVVISGLLRQFFLGEGVLGCAVIVFKKMKKKTKKKDDR